MFKINFFLTAPVTWSLLLKRLCFTGFGKDRADLLSVSYSHQPEDHATFRRTIRHFFLVPRKPIERKH